MHRNQRFVVIDSASNSEGSIVKNLSGACEAASLEGAADSCIVSVIGAHNNLVKIPVVSDFDFVRESVQGVVGRFLKRQRPIEQELVPNHT